MPLRINVPYDQKEMAKAKGAFWAKEEKTWFIPDHRDINNFAEWIDRGEATCILKSPLYIVCNTRYCWRCSGVTPVISLASYHFYYLRKGDPDRWVKRKDFRLFSYIDAIDLVITPVIKKNFPFYKIGYSKTVGRKYWINHCVTCNAIQGDFYMHEEIDGVFSSIDAVGDAFSFARLTFPFDIKITAEVSWESNIKRILRG